MTVFKLLWQFWKRLPKHNGLLSFAPVSIDTFCDASPTLKHLVMSSDSSTSLHWAPPINLTLEFLPTEALSVYLHLLWALPPEVPGISWKLWDQKANTETLGYFPRNTWDILRVLSYLTEKKVERPLGNTIQNIVMRQCMIGFWIYWNLFSRLKRDLWETCARTYVRGRPLNGGKREIYRRDFSPDYFLQPVIIIIYFVIYLRIRQMPVIQITHT